MFGFEESSCRTNDDSDHGKAKDHDFALDQGIGSFGQSMDFEKTNEFEQTSESKKGQIDIPATSCTKFQYGRTDGEQVDAAFPTQEKRTNVFCYAQS